MSVSVRHGQVTDVSGLPGRMSGALRLAGQGKAGSGRDAAATMRVGPVRGGPVGVQQGAATTGVQERRMRRRAAVLPMYTSVVVRVMALGQMPVEGHVVDVSETGMAVEIDELVAVGAVVTVEFVVAGLGHVKEEEWPRFAAAAVVVRHEEVEDFPMGPYRTGLKFVQMTTMMQARIARFVATRF